LGIGIKRQVPEGECGKEVLLDAARNVYKPETGTNVRGGILKQRGTDLTGVGTLKREGSGHHRGMLLKKNTWDLESEEGGGGTPWWKKLKGRVR